MITTMNTVDMATFQVAYARKENVTAHGILGCLEYCREGVAAMHPDMDADTAEIKAMAECAAILDIPMSGVLAAIAAAIPARVITHSEKVDMNEDHDERCPLCNDRLRDGESLTRFNNKTMCEGCAETADMMAGDDPHGRDWR